MNLAFDDALFLSSLLESLPQNKALERYSQERIPEMEAVHALGHHAYNSLSNGPHAFRRWYQKSLSQIFPTRYPHSLYSIMNFSDPPHKFEDVLKQVKHQVSENNPLKQRTYLMLVHFFFFFRFLFSC